jgi:alcohol dehydrogenase YqhD (iron-dependent ADH family)
MALSALYDVTHGPSLSAVWSSWARFVKNENPARFAQLGRRVFGVTAADDSIAADQAIDAVENFYRSIDMPTSLHELMGRELSQEELEAAARECSYNYTRKIGTFRVLDADDMLAIYRAAQ